MENQSQGSLLIHFYDFDIPLRILRPLLLHVNEESSSQLRLHRQHLLPKHPHSAPLHHKRNPHRTTDLLLPHPPQFPTVLLPTAQQFLLALRRPSGLVRVQTPQKALSLLEEQQRMPGGASHDPQKERRPHHLHHRCEVHRLRLVQPDPREDDDDQVGTGDGEFAEEETVVVADNQRVVLPEEGEGFLKDEGDFAGGEPVLGFLMGVDVGSQGGEGLYAEAGGRVVPEEREYSGEGEAGVSDEQIGDEHLGDPQHAAPAGVGGVERGGQTRGDVGAVGEQHELLGVVETGVAEHGQQTRQHILGV